MKKEVIRITKRFSFEMAHALRNYDGKCKFLHGHSYQLYVTLKGIPEYDSDSPKDGMVIDFSILKKLVNEQIIDIYDHSLVINEKDDRKEVLNKGENRTIVFPFQPTCENLLITFKNTILEHLPSHLTLVNVKLYETSDSYAEWELSDQQ